MANANKKFKQWERKFTKEELDLERKTWLKGYENPCAEDLRIKWYHKVDSWPQDVVQKCVYEVSDAEEWQRFRVSLKGLTTYEKLYCLAKYYSMISFDTTGADKVRAQIEKCRIDNYLGALVRGGQLNTNYEVIR